MNRILNINGLKWLLVLGTVADHVFNYSQLGHICVCAFFVISGFLMENKRVRRNKLSVSNFAEGILRFIPAHVTMLCIIFAMQIVMMKKCWIMSFFCHLFLIQSWIEPACQQPINGMSWYLSSWIALSMGYILLTKANCSKYMKGLIAVVFGFIAWIYGFNVEDKWWFYYLFPLAHIFDYLLGVMLVHLPQKITSIIQRNANSFQIVSIIFFVTVLEFSTHINLELPYSSNLIYIPCSVILVAVFVYTDKATTILNSLLQSKLFQWGGNICMQIFLYHFFFVSIFHHALPQISLYIQFIACVVIVMLVSHFASIYYEKPIVDWLKFKLFKNSK